MFDQIFLSPQVKRRVVINNKHFTYELLHDLDTDLKAQSCKLKKHCQMIAYAFQKYPENLWQIEV